MTTISPLFPAPGPLALKRLDVSRPQKAAGSQVISGAAPILGATSASPNPAPDANPATAWADNARALRAAGLAWRLETADKILDALRPLAGVMLKMGGGVLGRPLAGTIEGVTRSLSDLVRDFEHEADRAHGPGIPDAHRDALRTLGGNLTGTLRRTADLAMWVHAAGTDTSTFGRRSTRQIIGDVAGPLVSGWDRSHAALARLTRPPSTTNQFTPLPHARLNVQA